MTYKNMTLPLAAFDTLPIGVCKFSVKDKRITYCNSRFQSIFGENHALFAQENIEELLDVEWKSAIGQHDALKQQKPLGNSTIVVHDGQEYKLQAHFLSATERNVPDDEVLLFATLRDTSLGREQSQRQLLTSAKDETILDLSEANARLSNMYRELLESRENLSAAFDAGNLGSCGVDFITGEVVLSDRARSFFGFSPTEHVTWDSLLSQIDSPYHALVNKAFQDALHKGMPVDSTYPLTKADSGERGWVRVVARVHLDNDQKPIKVFGIIMDVTEQKEQDQLKNDFIAMVSHELKTPLTSLTSFVQIVQRKLVSIDQNPLANLLERANQQAAKISRLINGFLNVSRLEAGQITLVQETFDFGQLVQQVMEETQLTKPWAKINFKMDVNVMLYGDRDKIGQVVNNLISNALKYGDKKQAVCIDCTFDSEQLSFKITDSGIGINSDDQPFIFDRFYRANRHNYADISGFGIGLYICREIISMHGGAINVESEIGRGSSFFFTLPNASTT